MGVHPWPAIDPASAYMTMTGGAGAAPMHAASAALSTLGGAVDTTVASSAVNDVVVGGNWSGVGRIAAVASVTRLNTDETSYGQSSLLKSQLLAAAGELHTMTPPRMVTHVQANANRFEYAVDNAINPWVWGALTPRLIDLDTEYFGFMWPNNAAAGLSYGAGLDAISAALSALSALPSLAGGSVAAPAMAAADVGANAGITMASAAMSATEQAATAAIAPAAASATQTGSSVLGQAPLSAPATSPATPAASPMAHVSTHAPAPPSMGQAHAPAMGMFLPPSTAAVNAPTPAPPVQTMTPTAAVTGAPPGVTSFVKPAEPFKAPPMPSGGQATGLSPGMLNASALRGPVTSTPLTTTATSTLATTTQPLAYVPPDIPRPPVPPTPPQQPLLNPGDIAPIQQLQPPHAPPINPPPQPAPQPAAPETGSPPGPSTGSGDPHGSGGPGAQMPGSGIGQASPAPPPAIPLDTRPPIPSPPEPGQPPLQPPSPPSWALPPIPPSVQAALDELDRLEKLIQLHNSKPPDSSNLPAVLAYNAEADYYNSWAAQLQGKLDSSNTQYKPATTANTAEIPPWTQPAPQQPVQQGPQPPQKVQDILKQIDEGKWPQAANAPGTKGGSPYKNRDEHLPTTDASGKPITYQEWDVNPKAPDQDRGIERIVTGSDGSAWYTPDHYTTFQRLR